MMIYFTIWLIIANRIKVSTLFTLEDHFETKFIFSNFATFLGELCGYIELSLHLRA